MKKLELKSIDTHGNDVVCNLMDDWLVKCNFETKQN